MAGEMRAALERYSREEIIDLMTHILRVYVLEETSPFTPDVQQPKAVEELARLTFPQLLLHLQMSLQHDELGLFRVSGNDIFVSLGEREFLLGGPTPEFAPPPAAPAQRAEPRNFFPEPPMHSFEELPAAPAAPVTGEPDFELDDFIGRGPETVVVEEETRRPSPEPLGARSTPKPSKADSLFGGGSPRNRPAPPLNMSPPKRPPPIASKAPGDLPPAERSAARAASSSREIPLEEEPAPALADGDKDIRASNRFADLELE